MNMGVHDTQMRHVNGCAWDQKTCDVSAYNGKLECLKFACENGCPHDTETYESAVEGGHRGCVQYLRTVCKCPIESAMEALDDIKERIPEGKYITICHGLMHAHRSKKAT